MSELSEAEGLLRSGALYSQRVGLRRPDGEWILVGFKHGAFSIYFGDAPFFHFDLDGRWQRAFIAGTHYLKGLDTAVEAIERVREGSNLILHRRALSYAEASDLDASVRSIALDLITEIHSGGLEVIEPPEPTRTLTPEPLLDVLERISRWDAAAWFSQREQYLSTYGPWSFLPPDSQPAAVLQATLGHADGRAFSGAMPTEHDVRTSEEFQEHVKGVARLLGARIVQCRSLSLAGPDILRRPIGELETALDLASKVFPIAQGPPRQRLSERPIDEPILNGIHAFLDDFSPPLPDRADWVRLRARHLHRVCLGIESGAEEVRALYGSTWAEDFLFTLVADLNAAGIGKSFVVPVGAGGVEHRDRHEDRTVEQFEAIDLGPGDLIYLIDAVEIGGEAHQDRLRGLGLTPLDGPATLESRTRLKQRLGRACCGRGAKVATYSLLKQPGSLDGFRSRFQGGSAP
ncbi:hypothetical protein BH23PLA1_BH23PLA1_21190 [soil metagenome]